MQAEIIQYYMLSSLLIQPRMHIVSYLHGKKQKILSATEISTFMIEKDNLLTPREYIIGGADDELQDYPFDITEYPYDE